MYIIPGRGVLERSCKEEHESRRDVGERGETSPEAETDRLLSSRFDRVFASRSLRRSALRAPRSRCRPVALLLRLTPHATHQLA